MHPIKILILRFSSIGDIVLTTPVVRVLKEQLEETEIHYFSKPAYREILEANPHIDKVHLLQENLSEQLKKLDKENFDFIIDLHNNIRTHQVKSRLKSPYFSLNKLNFKKWLLVNFKINKLPDKHIVDRYFDTLDLLDVEPDKKGLEYFFRPEDEIDIKKLPEFLHEKYIGFAIGAKHETKKLTQSKIEDIISNLDHPVILLGDKNDEETGDIIAGNLPGKVYNACGKFSINQSASLVKQSSLMITHDTGLMHVAAAFNKIILSVWGNTVPVFGMYPYLSHPDSKIFEVNGLKCRPCSKIGYKKCPRGHFKCINDIDGYELARYANSLLRRHAF
jgi:ADP-heptose:LPS heptosyltransferase